MIPDFNQDGLLHPPSTGFRIGARADEVRQRFVVERGSPDWRVRLFDGWDLVRNVVGEFFPSATWWLWGCFVSSHEHPVFGDDETCSAVVMLPVDELPSPGQLAAAVGFLSSAEQYGVDVGIVYEFDSGHPAHIDTIEALELVWRPRAIRGFADHVTKELVPAGFPEVTP